jgi:hypothetical protein
VHGNISEKIERADEIKEQKVAKEGARVAIEEKFPKPEGAGNGSVVVTLPAAWYGEVHLISASGSIPKAAAKSSHYSHSE